MSRDGGVTFEHVRKACFEILGRGERPTRAAVQDLLVSDGSVGRKGGTEQVQRYIGDFWASLGSSLQMPARTVEGVPESFVAIIDKALREMTAVAQQIATEKLAQDRGELDKRAKEVEAAVEVARDMAAAADQLRIRAEGELAALQVRLSEMRGDLATAERKLEAEALQVRVHLKTIEEKDGELRRQFASLETANRSLDQANDQHRQEVARLMQLLDNERLVARKDAQQNAEQLECARAETESARTELSELRQALAQLRTEQATLVATSQQLETTLHSNRVQLNEANSALQDAQREVMALKIRHETAEHHRQEAAARVLSQAEEIGRLRREKDDLELALAAVRAKPDDNHPIIETASKRRPKSRK